MLVLRRKQGESIILAGSIKVTILSVEGDRVKIGIQAPPDVVIVREELLYADYQERHQQQPPLTVQPVQPSVVGATRDPVQVLVEDALWLHNKVDMEYQQALRQGDGQANEEMTRQLDQVYRNAQPFIESIVGRLDDLQLARPQEAARFRIVHEQLDAIERLFQQPPSTSHAAILR